MERRKVLSIATPISVDTNKDHLRSLDITVGVRNKLNSVSLSLFPVRMSNVGSHTQERNP